MAGPTGPGKHPVQIPPVRPLYRFAATGLGATMWFFVNISSILQAEMNTDVDLVDVSREKRW